MAEERYDDVARRLDEPTQAERSAALARIAEAGVARLAPDELRAIIDERDDSVAH